MSESKYFQFPLCALAFFATVSQRLEHIRSYAVVEAGVKLWNKADEHLQEKNREEIMSAETPHDFDFKDDDHFKVMLGARETNVAVGSIESTISRHAILEKARRDFELKYKTDAEVRMRTDIFWDANSGSITYRDFAVLCAIYSVIGAKKGPVRITRDMIRARALGYKSKSILAAKLPRADGAQPLTDTPIRDAISRLHEKGFFSKLNPSPRKAYYSLTMTQDEMAVALLETETKRESFLAENRKKSLELQQQIRARKQSLRQSYYSGSPIIAVPEPNEDQVATTAGP